MTLGTVKRRSDELKATKEIRTALAMGADRAVHLVADPSCERVVLRLDTLGNGSGEITAGGASLACLAATDSHCRVAHAIVYVAGIPYLHTLAFLVSVAGMMAIAKQVVPVVGPVGLLLGLF